MTAPHTVVDLTPDEVRDETFLPPPGQPRYVLTLNDDQVEQLASGVVDEALSRRAFAMLEWKRQARKRGRR